MNLNENFRKFPIKFYRKQDGTIHYENKFLSGDAKTMEKAFKIFSGNDWERDLLFYYDDVTEENLEEYFYWRKQKGNNINECYI